MRLVIKPNFLAAFFCLPILVCVLDCAPLYAQDKIVAIVNNEVVTQKDLDDFLRFMSMQLSREHKGKELENKLASLRPDLLNRLIEDRLILQEARKEKISLDGARVKAKLDEIKRRYRSEAEFHADLVSQGITQADIENKIREQFLMFAIVEQKVRSGIIIMPDEITEFYEKNREEFLSPEERQIEAYALENADLAGSFANYLKSGKKPEELATRYPFTMNRFSASSGEDLNKEIEAAVFDLGINEVSDPVKLDDKHYVFRLIHINAPRKLSLNEAQSRIQPFLFEKKMQEEMVRWIDELRAKSYIKIN